MYIIDHIDCNAVRIQKIRLSKIMKWGFIALFLLATLPLCIALFNRPLIHFTPERNWMNDPNGLVYFDGEYHLFYQHNPFGETWGHMSWGHAVSTDLLHWEHLPIAIFEQDGIMAFSGSAVVDWENTSGFSDGETPPLIAIYTGRRNSDNRQWQEIAYSTDHGRTWTKYGGNPVLDIGSTGFRDPKIFWYAPDRRWIMVVALADQRKVSIYGSPDLKEWKYASNFGPVGAFDGAWECPDLFELPVDGDKENTRWVMQVDVVSGGVDGGSDAQYFIGHFNGKEFFPAPVPSLTTQARWVDHGPDFYAVQSWSDIPESDGRRIWIAWMNNWLYADKMPTIPWRGAMTIPREVQLTERDGTIILKQKPVYELEKLRRTLYRYSAREIRDNNGFSVDENLDKQALEILIEFELDNADTFGLKFISGDKNVVEVGYDVLKGELYVNRFQSGNVKFSVLFPGTYHGPLTPENGIIRLQIYLDRSSIEVFGNDGITAITGCIFPIGDITSIDVFAKNGSTQIRKLDIYEIKSMW
jgi:fructan beta-fructosidase